MFSSFLIPALTCVRHVENAGAAAWAGAAKTNESMMMMMLQNQMQQQAQQMQMIMSWMPARAPPAFAATPLAEQAPAAVVAPPAPVVANAPRQPDFPGFVKAKDALTEVREAMGWDDAEFNAKIKEAAQQYGL